jgi:hypothetical protein
MELDEWSPLEIFQIVPILENPREVLVFHYQLPTPSLEHHWG